MDSYTLSFVVIIFLVSLALYFATVDAIAIIPPPPPLPAKPALKAIKISAALLRQNVAVGRLVRMQGLL